MGRERERERESAIKRARERGGRLGEIHRDVLVYSKVDSLYRAALRRPPVLTAGSNRVVDVLSSVTTGCRIPASASTNQGPK